MSPLEARGIAAGLLAVLAEAFEGAAGPSTYFADNREDAGLLGAVARLDATQASREIAGTSVAAHVHHVVFAMDASSAWMAGDRAPRDWATSWDVVAVDHDAWAALRRRLQSSYRELVAAIRSAAGFDEDAFTEAVGAIAHVAYHLGSIWQKVAALGDERERGD